MVEYTQALLVRKTGHDVGYWAGQARSAGLTNDAGLRAWMRDEHGVTGYAQYAVSWELFGYPDFMLRDADELIDGQYGNHPGLRPIADALLAWASATEGVEIQMRKGYVSLLGPRRKFAQVTRTTNTAVDVALRLDAAPGGRLEALKSRADDPFDRRVRLTSVDQVDDELMEILGRAFGPQHLSRNGRRPGRRNFPTYPARYRGAGPTRRPSRRRPLPRTQRRRRSPASPG